MPETDMPQLKRGVLARLIRSRRDDLQMTQRELARKLGYKYANFITMLEAGNAQFPFNRWEDFADAMQIEKPEFLRAVLEELYPRLLEFLQLKDTGREEKGEFVTMRVEDKKRMEEEIARLRRELNKAKKYKEILAKIQNSLGESED